MTAANALYATHGFSRPCARKRRGEPSLDDILAGPIVRALMLADHVDAEALTAMLRSVASRLRERARVARPARPHPAPAQEPAFGASQRGRIQPVAVEIATT